MKTFFDFWNKHKRNIQWITICLLGFLLVLGGMYQKKREKIHQLKENHLYTIGTIRSFDHGRHGRIYARFSFSYLDSMYLGSKRVTEFQAQQSHQIGKKFLVIFSPENPNLNYFLPFYANTLEWKNEGWNEPPGNLSSEKIFNYLASKI